MSMYLVCLFPVPAYTGNGKQGSDGDQSNELAEKKEDEGGGHDRDEKTAAIVIGEFLGKLPLSKLKIIIGASKKLILCFSGEEVLVPS